MVWLVTVKVITGDCMDVLRGMPECFRVNTCVTSPPYWGLRDYGHEGQIGLETSPDAYVARLVEVFRAVREKLADDGTLWLNLGDTYAANRGGSVMPAETLAGGVSGRGDTVAKRGRESAYQAHRDAASHGLKHKDLCGIPWRVALALQADGWYLRSDIIWAKPNPMPESVTDRPTKSHEYIFLLSKSERYYYDADAIREAYAETSLERMQSPVGSEACKDWGKDALVAGGGASLNNGRTHAPNDAGRNKRSVWTVTTKPYSGAHFATFPPDLIEPCILAGCPVGGTVLDPFGGAGTTGLVADRLQRNAVLIELNPEYADMARNRVRNDAPLFADVTA